MSFQELMQNLQKEYVANLPIKIADIESHLATHSVQTLREDFHKLKGTGKTYGIPEISVLGETVETICLHKPEVLGEAIPQAVIILREIHACRLNSSGLTLEGHESFERLRSYLHRR